ncbi:MAG: DUF1836 domain-containing protein [Clostridiales bacterium]|nr:DUF1836 domain-containing protein [Clostridiales bacterium]
MNKDTNEWLHDILKDVQIPSEDIPNIDLYMDQVTTFMDTRLAETRRYPEDKILTKTMINNYAKNHLLPPSEKKKYSKEHILLLIIIYRLKNMLSITDIQNLLEPLTEKYFPENDSKDLSMKEIYDKLLQETTKRHPDIEEQVLKDWSDSRDSFSDHILSQEDSDYLDDLVFIYKLCYDIYIRKQTIEKIIDYRRQQQASADQDQSASVTASDKKSADKRKGKAAKKPPTSLL